MYTVTCPDKISTNHHIMTIIITKYITWCVYMVGVLDCSCEVLAFSFSRFSCNGRLEEESPRRRPLLLFCFIFLSNVETRMKTTLIVQQMQHTYRYTHSSKHTVT